MNTDNQQEQALDLEKLTNETLAEEYNYTPETTTPEVEAPTEGQSLTDGSQKVESAPSTSNAPTPQVPQSGQAPNLPEDVLKALEETPYKSIPDVVKGYKEIQKAFNETREKVKPHQQLIDEVSADPKFAEFIQQAQMLYKNPQLAQAYQGAPQVDAVPDPRAYDMTTVEGYGQYMNDLSNYQQRQFDARINARLSQIEQTRQLDQQKYAFKEAFPDVDPEEAIQKIQAKTKQGWSMADAWKAMDYDNLKSKALEEARKELTKKLETAGQTATPSSASPSKPQAGLEDVVNYTRKYGSVAARKRYGDKTFMDALNASSQYYQ